MCKELNKEAFLLGIQEVRDAYSRANALEDVFLARLGALAEKRGY